MCFEDKKAIDVHTLFAAAFYDGSEASLKKKKTPQSDRPGFSDTKWLQLREGHKLQNSMYQYSKKAQIRKRKHKIHKNQKISYRLRRGLFQDIAGYPRMTFQCVSTGMHVCVPVKRPVCEPSDGGTYIKASLSNTQSCATHTCDINTSADQWPLADVT